MNLWQKNINFRFSDFSLHIFFSFRNKIRFLFNFANFYYFTSSSVHSRKSSTFDFIAGSSATEVIFCYNSRARENVEYISAQHAQSWFLFSLRLMSSRRRLAAEKVNKKAATCAFETETDAARLARAKKEFKTLADILFARARYLSKLFIRAFRPILNNILYINLMTNQSKENVLSQADYISVGDVLALQMAWERR